MPSPSHLRVRNFDRYQYALKDATKRTRIAFNIDAALLDSRFKGYGGNGRLGAWIKTLALAAREENELPANTPWWRENFGRHGDQWRDKLIEWDWLTPVQADSGADSGADSSSDSGSPNIQDEPESKVPNSGPLTSVPWFEDERDSTPDVEVEEPLLSTNVNVSSTDVTSTEDVEDPDADPREDADELTQEMKDELREHGIKFPSWTPKVIEGGRPPDGGWPDVPGWSRPSDVLAELLERRNG